MLRNAAMIPQFTLSQSGGSLKRKPKISERKPVRVVPKLKGKPSAAQIKKIKDQYARKSIRPDPSATTKQAKRARRQNIAQRRKEEEELKQALESEEAQILTEADKVGVKNISQLEQKIANRMQEALAQDIAAIRGDTGRISIDTGVIGEEAKAAAKSFQRRKPITNAILQGASSGVASKLTELGANYIANVAPSTIQGFRDQARDTFQRRGGRPAPRQAVRANITDVFDTDGEINPSRIFAGEDEEVVARPAASRERYNIPSATPTAATVSPLAESSGDDSIIMADLPPGVIQSPSPMTELMPNFRQNLQNTVRQNMRNRFDDSPATRPGNRGPSSLRNVETAGQLRASSERFSAARGPNRKLFENVDPRSPIYFGSRNEDGLPNSLIFTERDGTTLNIPLIPGGAAAQAARPGSAAAVDNTPKTGLPPSSYTEATPGFTPSPSKRGIKRAKMREQQFKNFAKKLKAVENQMWDLASGEVEGIIPGSPAYKSKIANLQNKAVTIAVDNGQDAEAVREKFQSFGKDLREKVVPLKTEGYGFTKPHHVKLLKKAMDFADAGHAAKASRILSDVRRAQARNAKDKTYQAEQYIKSTLKAQGKKFTSVM